VAKEVLIKQGGKIIVGDSDCNPTAGVGLAGTETDNMDFLNLLDATWLQSAKFDFGLGTTTTLWGSRWRVVAGLEFDSAPVAGDIVDFYLGYSDSGTAANDNPGNLSGSSAAYNGYGAAAADAAEAAKQLVYIGSLVCTADADVQIAEIAIISPPSRYGILVVNNESNVTIADTDGIETSVHFIEIIEEVQ